MAIATHPFDAVRYLDSENAIAAYIAAAFEDGDPSVIAAAIGDVARARGMTTVAKEAGLSRESLYRALSQDGHPEFATIQKVLGTLGFRLSAVPVGVGEKDSAGLDQPAE